MRSDGMWLQPNYSRTTHGPTGWPKSKISSWLKSPAQTQNIRIRPQETYKGQWPPELVLNAAL
jgi:hypothetical protein